MSKIEDVLTALRQVIRATDLHSRHLVKTVGLTAPQTMVMLRVRDGGPDLTIGEVARRVALSQATVTIIVDKLEKRGFVYRQRSEEDRRKVKVRLTEEGEKVLKDQPQPLQEAFVRRFEELEDWEQSQMVATLQRIARMMEADDMDAWPILMVGEVEQENGERAG